MRLIMRVVVGTCAAACGLAACAQALDGSKKEAAVVDLRAGELVPLRMVDMLSSTESTPGQVLRLEVAANVVYSGRVVMREGDGATAVVTRAEQHHRRGQGGRVSMQLRDVTLADGTQLVLDKRVAEGGGGIGSKKYKTLLIASLVLLSPAGTAVALLNHGQEIVLPTGTYIEAKITADQQFAAERFPPAAAVSAATPAAVSGGARTETLSLTTSAGDGSVRVENAYMGEAPLTMELKPGTYLVRVDHDGFREWKQKVVVNSGPGAPLKLFVNLGKP